jgi:[acyl-carrier-protein] S-malonyltransferase
VLADQRQLRAGLLYALGDVPGSLDRETPLRPPPMTRVALLFPGRGSYTEKSLGTLSAFGDADPLVRAAEALRAELGLEPLLTLDGSARFEPARHLRPANAAALIYLGSMLDARAVVERERVVAIGGNSLGWYTALAGAGALSFEDGFRLVQQMALLQEDGEPGGQVIYPIVDEEWRPSPAAKQAVHSLLASARGEIFPSIDLGGYAVLAGTPVGVTRLLKELPPVTLGKTRYPFRLAQHGPYHTPLASSVAARAADRLADLEFHRPRHALVDGRGVRFSPHSADLAALRAYTLGHQVDRPYDFTASVRVILREYAPDRLILPGPGNTLGGVCAQILIALGARGIHSRADFDAVQAGDQPPLESLRR